MAHSLRIEFPVGYYHFMNRSQSRRNIFLDKNKSQTVFRLAFRQFAATEDGDLHSGKTKKSLIS